MRFPDHQPLAGSVAQNFCGQPAGVPAFIWHMDSVNPLAGASTSIKYGAGKTFPGAATPFGLVPLSPDTSTGGDNGSGYSPAGARLRKILPHAHAPDRRGRRPGESRLQRRQEFRKLDSCRLVFQIQRRVGLSSKIPPTSGNRPRPSSTAPRTRLGPTGDGGGSAMSTMRTDRISIMGSISMALIFS